MRLRSRILLTAGLACLSTAMLAGGALAHGGDGHKCKFGKILQARARGPEGRDPRRDHGAHADVDHRSATADVGCSAAHRRPVPLAAPSPSPDADLSSRAIPGRLDGDRFRRRGHRQAQLQERRRRAHGLPPPRGAASRLTKLVQDRGHRGHRGFSVEVEARGAVVSADLNSITVDPGTPADRLAADVTCTIGKRTRSFGTLIAGDTVKIECKSKNGVLVAKRIKKKGALKDRPDPGQGQGADRELRRQQQQHRVRGRHELRRRGRRRC